MDDFEEKKTKENIDICINNKDTSIVSIHYSKNKNVRLEGWEDTYALVDTSAKLICYVLPN